MSGFPRHALKTLVVEGSRSSKPANRSEVWSLNLDQIESDTGRILAKRIVPIEQVGPSTYPFEMGTVLYSKLRPYLNKIVVADAEGFATTELVPLRCNPEKLFPEYLAYFLRSTEFLQFANIVVAGAKMPRMVMSEFWNYKIPVPPLPEQRRIAAILDQADALRAKRREALAQLDSFTQSIFIEMFGDPVSNPKDCISANLGDAISEMQYGPRFYNEAYSLEGIRIVRITDLDASGTLDFDSMPKMDIEENSQSQFILRSGDIVFARTGATVGKVALIGPSDPPCIAGAYFIRLRFKDSVLPEYAFSVLRTKTIQSLIGSQSRQAAQQNFSGPGLRRLPMPIPSLPKQQEFREHLKAINLSISVQQKSLSQFSTLISSLQHHAFRGEL